jgi:ATP-dependent Zn protease
MGWLSANWIWILLIGAMLWMHLRHGGMHGGHGGHGGHGQHQQNSERHDHVGVTSADDAGNRDAGHWHGGC